MNNGMITFEALLATAQAVQAQANGEAVDPKQLEKAREKVQKLEQKLKQVQDELNEARKELAELEKQANAYVRKAIEAAKVLGVAIPEEYQKMTRSGNSSSSNGKSGKYWFEFEGHKAFSGSLTDGLWRLSKGCGTAGKNGEKVFTADEFWAFFKQETGEDKMQLGKKYWLEFPNGEKGYIQKLEE